MRDVHTTHVVDHPTLVTALLSLIASSMSDSAFVSHLVSQTRANIDFLQAQGYLSVQDAANIQAKLASATVKAPSEKSVNMPVSTLQPYTPAPSHQPNPPNPPNPSNLPNPPNLPNPLHLPQSTPIYPKARALWPYNEDGRVRNLCTDHPTPRCSRSFLKEPNDLTMSAGDIIDIVEETNADWWTGRNRGKQGLIPSNYVQKFPPGPSPQPYPEKAHIAPGYTNYGNPPPPQQMNPGDNVPAVNSVGLQPDDGQAKKKNKFGKFGNTVCSFPLPFQPPSLSSSYGNRWPIQLLEE